MGLRVVLVHGLPEFWYSWRYQIPVLAERIRFVAPELRGYNLSEDPQAGYDIEHHPALPGWWTLDAAGAAGGGGRHLMEFL